MFTGFPVVENVALRLENDGEEVVGVRETPSSCLVRNLGCLHSSLEMACTVELVHYSLSSVASLLKLQD